MTDTSIPSDTLRAYRETHYIVAAKPRAFTLRVDTPSAALGALYQDCGVDCAAFLTACNPHGLPQDAAANALAQDSLRGDLLARGLTCFPGEGRHPEGSWPAEASFLALALALADARALGRRHRQNAVLWCGPDTIARLVLLR